MIAVTGRLGVQRLSTHFAYLHIGYKSSVKWRTGIVTKRSYASRKADCYVLKKPCIIDFHHHFFPPFTTHLFSSSYSRDVGWIFPEGILPWNPEVSLKAKDELDIRFSILSLTGSPSPAGEGVSKVNRRFARMLNEYAAEICSAYPNRFGFFANIPIPADTEAALDEIAFALDNLGALGVNLTSSYDTGVGKVYIGDPIYRPVWDELNKRRGIAVVFVHGAALVHQPAITPFPSELLGLPITSVPHETFKAAASLVLSGIMRTHSHCKVILAHCGGPTPLLASRVAMLSSYMSTNFSQKSTERLSYEEIMKDFKQFYYECALNGCETNMLAIDNFADADKILFGTDLPAISTETAHLNAANISRHYVDYPSQLNAVMSGNAYKILPRLHDYV